MANWYQSFYWTTLLLFIGRQSFTFAYKRNEKGGFRLQKTKFPRRIMNVYIKKF